MTAPREQKMWGGLFERGPDASFYEFERSWSFDQRMLPQELALDRAWARAIVTAGILTEEEGRKIATALDEIAARAKSDPAWLADSKAEDVHHFVESALIEKLGPLGAKLHTGRSRNEMVATEFRMYVKDAARNLRRALVALESAIAAQAETNLRRSDARHHAHATRAAASACALASRAWGSFLPRYRTHCRGRSARRFMPFGFWRTRRLRFSA